MRVKITDHPEHDAGAVLEVPAEQAVRLLTAGQAEPVTVKPADERETR